MQRIDRRLFVAGAGLWGLSPIAAFAQADNVAGKVAEAVGQVTAEGKDKKRPLAAQATVFIGDTIATGKASKLAMKLGQETDLRLGELSNIKIDSYLVKAGGTIQLNAGPLLLDKPPKAPPVSIRSPFGLISVRGTRVFAGPSRGVFGVFVLNGGSVTVTAAGTTITLEENTGTDIASRGAAPTAPARWGDERIRLALASVT
jgi:hypothetical protein